VTWVRYSHYNLMVFTGTRKFGLNGHFLGTEESGYNSFEYDISDYVNYGGENTIAIRVDASMEEGWFYEGAGIYRHVYLQKTNPLHVVTNGTYITSVVKDGLALITVEAYIKNHGNHKGDLQVVQSILDPADKQVASVNETCKVPAFSNTTPVRFQLTVSKPSLWDIDTPNLYTLVTQIKQDGKTIDSCETSFGIRTI
jgi:beta-galactosidase